MAIQHLTKLNEFQELIAKDQLVIVDFHAQWCGPCKVIGPKFEKLAAVFTDVVFVKVDVDEGSDIAQETSVRAMPTFMFFRNGQKLGEVVGANAAALEAKLKELSATAPAGKASQTASAEANDGVNVVMQ